MIPTSSLRQDAINPVTVEDRSGRKSRPERLWGHSILP
jgi:hypothetical protein